MIVWIAGWPHSGSALCRNLIEQTLEQSTYSRYIEKELRFMFGHKTQIFEDNWSLSYYLSIRDDKDTVYIVKTHGYESGGLPAIYVVRDGRNAIAGLANFWNSPVKTIITGEESAPFMDWTTHFKVWDPFNRPNTLVLRFEDILKEPDRMAGIISEAIDMPVKKKFDNRMDEYRERWPQLFKPQHSDWRLDFNEQDVDLFWRLHEETMIATGYGSREECENGR